MTTFGEGVLRLSVPAGKRISEANRFEVDAAGTEANVAAALAQLGWRTGWVSALPDTPVGRRVLNSFRRFGIDCSSVDLHKDGRVSCYYAEFAHPPRSIRVIYDRENSCFTKFLPEQVDWNYLLDTRHLHLSGLTVPLSESAATIIAKAIAAAHAAGISTSLDINYRQLLWSATRARATLLPLAQGVDVLFCSLRDAAKVFGCEGDDEQVTKHLARLAGAKNTVITLGSSGAIAWNGTGLIRENAWKVRVIDRIGAGDAFAAGVIYGWKDGTLRRGLRYGNLMAALALTQVGDMVTTSCQEIEELLSGSREDIVR